LAGKSPVTAKFIKVINFCSISQSIMGEAVAVVVCQGNFSIGQDA